MDEETVNHDDLWQRTYTSEDRESLKKVAADSLLPSGTYLKVGAGVLSKRTDAFNPGRPEANVMIRVAPFKPGSKTEVETKDDGSPRVVGTQFLRMSPVRVNWTTPEGQDTGQPDASSKLWTQANSAFRKTAGREPEGPAEVLDFLVDQPYRVRIIQKNTGEDAKGEPRNDVMAISALVSE